jgi:hypothetical protein
MPHAIGGSRPIFAAGREHEGARCLWAPWRGEALTLDPGSTYAAIPHEASRPGFSSAPWPSARLTLHDRRAEITMRKEYMVYDRVWTAAGMPPRLGFLCIACLELRLGRELTVDDLTTAPINDPRPNDVGRPAQIKGERRQEPGTRRADGRDD